MCNSRVTAGGLPSVDQLPTRGNAIFFSPIFLSKTDSPIAQELQLHGSAR